MTDLPATLKAVRALTAPSRDVADDVLMCFGWLKQRVVSDRHGPMLETPEGYLWSMAEPRPDPTASVDAAAALMPEDVAVTVHIHADGTAHTAWRLSGSIENDDVEKGFNEATARTAAALAAKIKEGKR